MTESTKHKAPKALVTAGSKHGATSEIANRIAMKLTASGCDTVVSSPDDVESTSGFDAVVLGSAVYAGRWTKDARQLVKRISRNGDLPPVWLFSSGPIGDQPLPTEEPVDVEEILAATAAVEHRIFAGKVDRAKLTFPERAILLAVRAEEGDFRDWNAIDAWAGTIADRLTGSP